MTDGSSETLARWRRYILFLLVFVVILTLASNPTSMLGWVLVPALLVALAIHVHRTSRAWLEYFGSDGVQPRKAATA